MLNFLSVVTSWRSLFITATFAVLFIVLSLASEKFVYADDVSARITLGPLSIQLTDLDPLDGVDPSFRWTQDAWTDEIERDARLNVGNISIPGPTLADPERTQIAGDILLQSSDTPSFVEIKGDLQGIEVFLTMDPGPEAKTASGFASINLDPSSRHFTSPQNYFGSNYTFEVTPNTAVLFSTDISAMVSNLATDVEAHSARTRAELIVGDLESEEPPDFEDPLGNPFRPRVLDASSDNWDGSQLFDISTIAFTGSKFEPVRENSKAETLSVEYVNSNNSVANGYFYLETFASLNTAATIVPEPCSACLALFILANLSLRRVRRQI